MQVKDTTVTVRVPATTANMGPGFDSFGMAFRYYDEVSARPISGHTRVYAKDEGAGAGVPSDDGNLIVRTLRVGLEAAGLHQSGFELHCTNRIPQGGGLGSSAAAIVAGLMLARGFAEDEDCLDDQAIFSIATALKGTRTTSHLPFSAGPPSPGWTTGASRSRPRCRWMRVSR